MTKKERSRIAIMHNAKILFEKKGLGNVTFADIAEESEMCRTTIFNYFPTFNDLLLALYREEVKDLTDHCISSGAEGKDLVYMLIDKLTDDTVSYPALMLQLITTAVVNEEKENPVKQVEDIICGALSDAGYENCRLLTIQILGAYYGVLVHSLAENRECIKEEISKDLTYIINHLLEV